MDRTAKGTFVKGHKGLKPKGSKHRSTELRVQLDEIISSEMANLPALLESIEKPEVRAKLLIDLIPYKIPKLQSIEYSTDIISKVEALPDEQLTILIEQVKALLTDEDCSGDEYLKRLFSGDSQKRNLPAWMKASEPITGMNIL